MSDVAALPAARVQVSDIKRTVVVATTAFLTVVDLFAAQAILPTLAKAYGVSPAAMGLAVNACTLGMAVASIVVAILSPRIDRRRGIVLALCLLSAPTVLLAAAPSIGAFAALRIVQGLCMATAFTLTLAYLGESCPSNVAHSAFAAYIAGNVASNLFGRIASAALADRFGLAANFVVFAGLNLAGAALVLATVRGARLPSMPQAFGRGWAGVAGNLGRADLRAAFVIGFCILFAFIGAFTFVNFVLVGPPIALDPMLLGVVYFVFAPALGTTLAAGAAATRFGSRAALLAGLSVAAAGLPLALAASLAAVLAGLVLIGVGAFFAQAVASGYVGRHATQDRGSASGLYLAAYFLGGLVGTAALGAVFEAWGWGACVAGVGLALLVAAVASRWLRA